MLATVDYVLLAFVVLIALFGLFRGAAREVVSLIFLALAVFLAAFFYQRLGAFLDLYFKSPQWVPLMSFLVIFLVVLFIGWILSSVLFAILPASRGAMTTFFGGVIGLIRGACLVFLLALLLNYLHLQDQSQIQTFVAKVMPSLPNLPALPPAASTQSAGQK